MFSRHHFYPTMRPQMSLSTDQQMMRFCCGWFFFYANASMPPRFELRWTERWTENESKNLRCCALPHLDPIGSDESHDLGNNLPPLPASANTTTAPTNTNTTIGVMNANINTHVDANAGANINTNRYQCPQCNTTCARDGDLSRHMKKHLPPQYDCLVNGCDRHGHKAFNRKDKLLDHQRKKHRMPV